MTSYKVEQDQSVCCRYIEIRFELVWAGGQGMHDEFCISWCSLGNIVYLFIFKDVILLLIN